MSSTEEAIASMSINGNGGTLAAIINGQGNVDQEAAQRARGAGWVEPQQYDYGTYNAKTREEREAVENTHDVPAWAANAAKYEWSDEYGDVGPKHPKLEDMLFRNADTNRKGNKFNVLQEIEVVQESEQKVMPVRAFGDAGLHPVMLENIELCGYEVPTPIQAYCIPAVLQNRDVIAVAQTGSGKTAAFLIPTLSKLMGKAKKLAAPRPKLDGSYDSRVSGVRAEPLILVVSPTRELSTQIFDEARRLCYRSMLRPCVAYGGAPVREQIAELQKGCDVLIATPGRLIDFMERPNVLSLARVKYTIIDEADEMVSADWQEEMTKIMSGGDNNEDDDHVYMMFSATFPKEARRLAKEHMAVDHIRIRVGRAGSTHLNVAQTIIWVEESKKREALYDLLLSMPPSRTIIFVNNKKGADFLDDYLYNKGLPSTSVHSDRTQREREDAVRAFKSGKAPIMVATGVSARGLDIKNVMHIVNYDLPSSDYGGIHEYVHRIGRTARIGNEGLATSFYNDKNADIADALTRILLESKQTVPDFLEQHKPEDPDNIDFDDESDNEEDGSVDANGDAAEGTGNDDAWGASDEPAAADAWGASEEPAAADTWESGPAASWD